MVRVSSIIVMSVMLAVTVPRAGAQASSASLWGGAGVGVGTAGLGLLLDLDHADAGRIWRGRFSGYNNLGGGWNPDAAQAGVVELSVLYGPGAPVLGGNFGAITAGAGWVNGRREHRNAPTENFNTVGLAVGAQLLSWRLPHLSIEAVGNLNPKMSFAGVTVSILLGSMPWTVR